MKDLQLGDIRITFDRHEVPGAFDAVVVILFCCEKIVLVRNPERGWEFPGGHRDGNETYDETAIREVREEVQIEIQELEYLGYYTSEMGHLTLIVCAECLRSDEPDELVMPSGVKVFDGLPSDLSFGDGREQLFLDVAREFRNLS